MEAGAGFVHQEQRPLPAATERGGQLQSLHLAIGEGRGRAAQRQVVEPPRP
jgi:hypothetical protein